MGSLYDRVKAVNSQFVPQFVGSEVAELKDVADTLQERYYRNKDLTDRIKMLTAQQRTREIDDPIKQARLNRVNEDINAIAGSKENFENSTLAAQKIASEFFTDQALMDAGENFKREQEYKDFLKKNPSALVFASQDPTTFSTVDPRTGKSRLIDYNTEPLQDRNAEFKRIIGQIAADGYYSINGAKIPLDAETKQSIQGILDNSYKGVDEVKVRKLVEAALPLYEGSIAGSQHVKAIEQANNSNSYNPLQRQDTIHTDKDLGQIESNSTRDQIRQQFISAIMPQAGRVREGSFSATNPDWMNGGKDNTNRPVTFPSTSPGTRMPNSYLQGDPANKMQDGEDLSKYYKRVLVGDKAPTEEDIKRIQEAVAKAKTEPNIQAQALEKNLDTKIDKEQYSKDLFYAKKKHQQVAPRAEEIVNKDNRETLNAQITNKLTSQGVTILPVNSSKAERNTTVASWVAKNVKQDDLSKIKYNSTKIIFANPDGSVGSGVEFNIIIGETPIATAIMPIDDQTSGSSKVIQEVIGNSEYSLVDKYNGEATDKPVSMIPDGTPNGTPAAFNVYIDPSFKAQTLDNGAKAYTVYKTATKVKSKQAMDREGDNLKSVIDDGKVFEGRLIVQPDGTQSLDFDKKKAESFTSWETKYREYVKWLLGFKDTAETDKIRGAKSGLNPGQVASPPQN